MFDSLNPEQRAAATHGEGPLLIVAGAGTGKTTTLAARVSCLLERGVRPERVLLLTFSRRAAREMLERAERQGGHRDAGRVWGGTFHAVANRLLRVHGRTLGLSPGFTVLDQSDGADVMNLLREELGYASRERRFPRKETLAQIHSRVVNAGAKLDAVIERHYPWCIDDTEGIREIFRAYVVRKREQQTLDYDDLLLFWKALAASPQTGPQVATMFDHILVDEYQDTNALQADILAAMRPFGTKQNLTVVGDDAQAIYGFRAATVHNILAFPERFPGAAIVKLERNYRSTAPILDLSNAVIALSPQRHEKTLWTERTDGTTPTLQACLDENDQADAICRSILARARARHAVEGAGRLVPRRAPFRPARGRAAPAQHPVREVRRAEVPGGGAREGRARDAARDREPARRGRVVPRAAAARGHGSGRRPARDGPDRCPERGPDAIRQLD